MSRITKYIEAESRLVDTKEWEEEGGREREREKDFNIRVVGSGGK